MYKRLWCSRIRVELTTHTYLGLGMIYICHVYASNAHAYKHGPCIHHLLEVTNYLNYYIPKYKRLTRFCIRMELASPAYMG